ncbi:hypothetical protein ACOBQX_30775 [Actinokineospora sp. G85]|uniref:hypothetical protein n=1 Tax=Actinokineospora sp. G85 TaxID=3406626 RepID=UPI003C784B00
MPDDMGDELRALFTAADATYRPAGTTTAESVITRGRRVRARRRTLAVTASAATVVLVLTGAVLLMRPDPAAPVPPAVPAPTSTTDGRVPGPPPSVDPSRAQPSASVRTTVRPAPAG